VEPAVQSVREEDSQPVELGATELLPTASTLDRIEQLVVPYQPRIVVYYCGSHDMAPVRTSALARPLSAAGESQLGVSRRRRLLLCS
jgi:hypothetical protein